MVGAVAAGVEVAAAARAGVAKADALARAQLDGHPAAEAAHAPSLHEKHPPCKRLRSRVQFRASASDSADVQDLDRPGPIFSRLVDDPAFAGAIDEFVVGVAERVDHLQDADSKGDVGELRRLAAQLGVDARAAGFDLLADVAEAVESACIERQPKPAHDGVVALTELAQRVRRGHRGAMS